MISYSVHTCAEMGGIYSPIIVCDACGRPITRSGNAYWIVLDDGQVLAQVWHTHKHPCSRLDDELQERYGGLVMSEELNRWLDQLVHNFTTAKETTR
ncbi:MAG: hypothetical protein ACR2H3_04390 [Acidimicrobiales bacterium]